MSISTNTLITEVHLLEKIYISLSSGDVLTIPYNYTPRLQSAGKAQLADYRLIGGGRGIHFPEIDEDISLRGIIQYKIEHELIAS